MNQKRKFYTIDKTYVLVFLLIVTVLPFLINALYNYPVSDDFVYANRFVNTSLFAVLKGQYFLWSGRYWATIVSIINPLNLGYFFLIKGYPFILILVFVSSLFFCLYQVFERYISCKNILALCSILAISLFCKMPNIFEAFYWFSGYITYTFPCIYFLLLIGIMAKYYKIKLSGYMKYIYTIICSLLVFFIVGSNELSMIVLDSFFMFIILVQFQKYKKIDSFILMLVIVAIITTLIVICAPGNHVRLAAHQGMNHINKLYVSLFTSFRFFYKFSPFLLFVSPIYYFTVGRIIASKNITFFNVNPIISIIYLLIVVFLLHAFYVFSTTVCPHDRMENVIYFFYLIAWFYTLQVFLNTNAFKTIFHFVNDRFYKVIAIVFFLIAIFLFETNVVTAQVDLISGKSAEFEKNRLEQTHILQMSKGTKKVIIPALKAVPKTLTPSTEPVNTCVTRAVFRYSNNYFNITSLEIQGDTVGVISNYETLRQMF